MTESAIHVLTNEDNMRLEVFPDVFEQDGTRKSIRFQDLVEQMFNIVEKMIDHQSSAANRSGKSLKCRARNRIDGWDIDDVVSERDCNPAIATLQNLGRGWVHLVNDIGAVIFLGRDFGEMIKPTSEAGCCKHWAELPVESYYLGVCVSDIVQIIKSYGDKNSTEPRKLTHSISWPDSDNRFQPCKCGNRPNHSDLPQTLQSPEKCKSLPGNKELAPNGAVIFRHNIELRNISRMFDRDKTTIKDSHTLQPPKDSVVGSSQEESSAQSSTSGGLRSGPSPGEAPLEPLPPSKGMNREPSASDHDIHRPPERGSAHAKTTQGEATGGEVDEGNTKQRSRQERRTENMVQGNRYASPNTIDRADSGQKRSRWSRFKKLCGNPIHKLFRKS